jgi:hypothetical protein
MRRKGVYLSYNNMKDRTAQLIEKRKRLAEQMPDPSAALTGSLMSRMVRCNKPNCRRCQKGGKGHGPIWILSVRESQGRVRQITVPQHLKPEVEEGLERFAEVQSLLRQIGEVNQQLLEERKRS